MQPSVTPSSALAAHASVSKGLVRGPLQWFASTMPTWTGLAILEPASPYTATAASGLVRTQDWR